MEADIHIRPHCADREGKGCDIAGAAGAGIEIAGTMIGKRPDRAVDNILHPHAVMSFRGLYYGV